MTDLPLRRGFRLNGWHVLGIVTAFFGIVIAVDVTFAVSAYRTFPGQVSVTPYEDGVAYNRRIAQMAAQERLGWTATAGVGERGEVSIEARDRAGAPLSHLALTGRLERPATEAGRIVLAFKEVQPGVYLARPGALQGAWDLTFDMTDPHGGRFEGERRLQWP